MTNRDLWYIAPVQQFTTSTTGYFKCRRYCTYVVLEVAHSFRYIRTRPINSGIVRYPHNFSVYSTSATECSISRWLLWSMQCVVSIQGHVLTAQDEGATIPHNETNTCYSSLLHVHTKVGNGIRGDLNIMFLLRINRRRSSDKQGVVHEDVNAFDLCVRKRCQTPEEGSDYNSL